jgi:alcohol dehydrogenase
MRQLTCTGPGMVEWREVEPPSLVSPGDALVRPVAVARCEIDPLLVMAGPRAVDGPGFGFALGHEAVVEIVALGPDVPTPAVPGEPGASGDPAVPAVPGAPGGASGSGGSGDPAVSAVPGEPGGLRVGQLALCSFQVGCGSCAACAGGRSAVCDEMPILSDYGMQPLSGTEYGGMLSDLVRVPHAATMLVPVPAGIDGARLVHLASVPDNVIDGYRSVAPHLAASPGADVLVVIHGSRSIGLYAALSAQARGAGSVTVESDDPVVLERAEAIGARAVPTDLGRHRARYPLVVDCGTRAEGLLHAVDSVANEGVLHSVSYYLDPTITLPLGKMYTRGVQFSIGRAHSASLLPEVVGLIAAGRLDPAPITTSVIGWDEAPDRYLDDTVKLVVTR